MQCAQTSEGKSRVLLEGYSLGHQLQCSGQGLGELGVVLHPLPAAILNDVIGQVHESELTTGCSCVCMHANDVQYVCVHDVASGLCGARVYDYV